MGKRGPKKGTKYKKEKIYKADPAIKLNAGNKIVGVSTNFSLSPESPEPINSEKYKSSESTEFDPMVFLEEVKPEEPAKKVNDDKKTEAEAKLVLAGFFELGALATQIPEFALTVEEKLGATPSFIPIYEEYIKPMLGAKPELAIFGFTMIEILGKRIPLVVEKYGKKNNPQIIEPSKN